MRDSRDNKTKSKERNKERNQSQPIKKDLGDAINGLVALLGLKNDNQSNTKHTER